jgi:hypothetical protein
MANTRLHSPVPERGRTQKSVAAAISPPAVAQNRSLLHAAEEDGGGMGTVEQRAGAPSGGHWGGSSVMGREMERRGGDDGYN